MRKFTAIFLLALFLSSNLGFSINTHYCGGQMQEYSIELGLADLSCGMEAFSSCDDPEKEQLAAVPCCDDKHQTLQVDEDLNQRSITSLAHLPFTIYHFTFQINPRIQMGNHILPEINSPPFRTGQQLLIAQQRFLI